MPQARRGGLRHAVPEKPGPQTQIHVLQVKEVLAVEGRTENVTLVDKRRSARKERVLGPVELPHDIVPEEIERTVLLIVLLRYPFCPDE